MSRREKIEIVYDILELCQMPRKKTNIVYQCNLNFKIVKRYITECFIMGWLMLDNGMYVTTKLGKDYLKLLHPVLNPFEVAQVQNI